MRKTVLELKSFSILPLSLISAYLFAGCASINTTSVNGLPTTKLATDQVSASSKAEYRFSTSSSADELYRLGRSALQSGYEGQAMTLFKAALKADPRHSDSRNGMAVILHSKNQYEEALELIRIALEHDPGSEMLLRNQLRVKEAMLARGSVAVPPTANASPEPVIAKAVDLPKVQRFTELNNTTSNFALVQVQANVYELKATPKLNTVEVAPATPVVLSLQTQVEQRAEVVQIPSASVLAVAMPTAPANASKPPVMLAADAIRPKKLPVVRRDPKVLIANGKGERGLACREAKGLALHGWKSSGCIDHSNFAQRRSVIYFVRGQEDAAIKVRSSLLQSGDVEIKRVNFLSKNADVQVLIGHDWSRLRGTQVPRT